tara:strand:+ start:399 stop:575 length:177 start_codon:yes stop_codon:yes gene_type:complete
MTKKDLRIIEKMIKKMLEEMLYEQPLELQGYDQAKFSLGLLEEMEAFLGHPIDFMGIS